MCVYLSWYAAPDRLQGGPSRRHTAVLQCIATPVGGCRAGLLAIALLSWMIPAICMASALEVPDETADNPDALPSLPGAGAASSAAAVLRAERAAAAASSLSSVGPSQPAPCFNEFKCYRAGVPECGVTQDQGDKCVFSGGCPCLTQKVSLATLGCCYQNIISCATTPAGQGGGRSYWVPCLDSSPAPPVSNYASAYYARLSAMRLHWTPDRAGKIGWRSCFVRQGAGGDGCGCLCAMLLSGIPANYRDCKCIYTG
jgi:hypothetical protein